jgi:O-antigen/teichoic acid export membrane protein
VNRGALATLGGHALRLLEPLLTLAVIRLFGEALWGQFLLAESAAFVATRVGVLGLDRGVLWQIARDRARGSYELGPLRRALRLTLFAGLASGGLGGLAAWFAVEPAAAWIMVSVPLSAVMSMLLAAIQASRSLVPEQVVRTAVLPIITRCAMLSSWPLGLGIGGLAAGHAVGYGAGLLAAWWLFRRRFARVDAPVVETSGRLDGPLLRYSLLAGLAELLATVLARVDLWVVAACLGPAAAGVYGVALSLVASIRSMRKAFDPAVIPVMAEASATRDLARARAAFAHAAYLVGCLTAPVVAVLWGLGPELLGLYGRSFREAAPAVVVLGAGSLGFNLLGLGNAVLAGTGRGGWLLATQLLSLGTTAGLAVVLVPAFGITGAALASATSLLLVALLEYRIAARWLGTGLLTARALEPIGVLCLAGGLALAVETALGRHVGFAGLAVVLLGWLWWRALPALRRAG